MFDSKLNGGITMSDENETYEKTSWWKRQSTGAKAAIGIAGICCLGLILIVGLSAMFSPDATTSTTSQSSAAPQSTTTTTNSSSSQSTNTDSSADQNYIEVSYPGGSWDGSITIQSGNNEEEINFDGSGTKRFDLTSYKDKDVYVNAQKDDGSSGKLSAVIVRDGETKLSQSTTEGYGIVSGWVFSWE